jgi:hypothetical protein
MQKDFPGWHRQKEQLHAQHQTPTFQEREIWWCSVGVNIGHEMDGKNQFYNRPVSAKLMSDSPENSLVIFIRGGEPWLMGHCWRTPF